jgi:precorrin-6B methylase 2
MLMGWTEYLKWQGNEGVRLLSECGVCSEMNILDFGCGIGEYSIPASIVVGENGKVIAIDNNLHRVNALRENCKKWGVLNVQGMKCNENSEKIREHSYDCVLYFDLYHAMGKEPQVRSEENQRILNLITQTLKPNGLLLISVFSEMCLIWDEKNGERTPKGSLKAQKVSIEEGIRWFCMIETIEKCGFEFQKRIDEALHFDEFYRHSDPDMNKFERGNIYVFKKI